MPRAQRLDRYTAGANSVLQFGGLAELDDSGERITGQFLGATAAVLGGAPVVRLQSGVVSELWAVYSGGALRLCCLEVGVPYGCFLVDRSSRP
jgi:hypothetical protein